MPPGPCSARLDAALQEHLGPGAWQTDSAARIAEAEIVHRGGCILFVADGATFEASIVKAHCEKNGNPMTVVEAWSEGVLAGDFHSEWNTDSPTIVAIYTGKIITSCIWHLRGPKATVLHPPRVQARAKAMMAL